MTQSEHAKAHAAGMTPLEAVPHADRDHSEQPGLTGDRKAADGFRCCVHCKDDVAYHEDNAPDSHDTECTLCTQALALRDAQQTPTPSTATAGSDPTHSGTSRSVSAREGCEERLTRFEEVLAEHRITGPSGWGRYGCEATDCDFDTEDWTAWEEHVAPHLVAVADAVVAAGDADEVTRLRAELKRLGLEVAKVARERSAAEAERDEIAGRLSALLCELTGGRLSKTTYDVRTMVAEIDSFYDDAHQEDWAELDRLAEVVARVEALAETMANEHGKSWNSITARRIQVALSGPTPAQTPQNGPEPALSREQGTSGQSGEGEALRGAEKGVPSIGDTCCGKCPGGTCYVDGVTGA